MNKEIINNEIQNLKKYISEFDVSPIEINNKDAVHMSLNDKIVISNINVAILNVNNIIYNKLLDFLTTLGDANNNNDTLKFYSALSIYNDFKSSKKTMAFLLYRIEQIEETVQNLIEEVEYSDIDKILDVYNVLLMAAEVGGGVIDFKLLHSYVQKKFKFLFKNLDLLLKSMRDKKDV